MRSASEYRSPSEPSAEGTAEVPTSARVLLASQSPRRRQLLTEAGIDFEVAQTVEDDGLKDIVGVEPRAWVMSLAFLKASGVRTGGAPAEAGAIAIGADTVCVLDDEIVGKPRDADHARDMLLAMTDRAHRVITGTALVKFSAMGEPGGRELFYDEAVVEFGTLEDETIEKYLESGDWRGKAGGYNLTDRLAEGWPIRLEGDPDTVVGLPVGRVIESLRSMTGQTAPERRASDMA